MTEPDPRDVVLDAARAVLANADVELADNFLDVGGDSLAALELTIILQEQLGFEVSLELVFESESLAQLAATIAAMAPGSGR